MIEELRKIVTFEETSYREDGEKTKVSLRTIGVAAILKKPWKDRGFVQDLSPEIDRIVPVVGKILSERIIQMVGSGERSRLWKGRKSRILIRSWTCFNNNPYSTIWKFFGKSLKLKAI